MKEKLNLISEKVDDVVALVERLRTEIVELSKDNQTLKTQINRLLKESKAAGLDSVDRKDAVKTKLNLVFNRLDELSTVDTPVVLPLHCLLSISSELACTLALGAE